jgi:hypothetical protein
MWRGRLYQDGYDARLVVRVQARVSAHAQKQAALKELVQEELKQGVIRVINHKAVMMYNPIFPVPKSDGQRKVTDCRHLNEEQKDIHFKWGEDVNN